MEGEEQLKPASRPPLKPLLGDAGIEAVSGAAGSMLALLATYPLKTIYTLQALSGGPQGQRSILEVVRKYKLRGLYIGIEPNVIETALSSGIYFYLYSKLRHFVVVHAKQVVGAAAPDQAGGSSKNRDVGVLSSLLVAALAGLGNQLLIMPAAVITTRMQAKSKLKQEGKLSRSTQVGWRSTVLDIMRESGVRGFWMGLLPSLVLVSNPAIQYMLYEQLQRMMRAWKGAATSGSSQQQQQQQQQHKQGQHEHDNSSFRPTSEQTLEHRQQELIGQEQRQQQQQQQHSSGQGLGEQSAEMRRLQEAWQQLQALHQQQQQQQQQQQPTPQHKLDAASSGSRVGGSAASHAPQDLQGSRHNIDPTKDGNLGEHSASAERGAKPVALGPLEIFTSSALAKVGATVATYWLVVVKSRMQATGKGTPVDMQYRGTLHAMATIWRLEGFGGFFRGLRAKLLQTALNAALMLMLKEQVYNATKRLLHSPSVLEGVNRLRRSSRAAAMLIGGP